MIRLIRAEAAKLAGSLALLVAVAVPALPGLLAFLALATGRQAVAWASVYRSFALPIWCLFLLPMTLAAFTTLLAQVEHRARAWDHLLALPIRRWQLFAAKAVVAVAAMLAITLLMLIAVWVGGVAGGLVGGRMPTGAPPWARFAELLPALMAGTLFLLAIQLWVALRYASFVTPLAVAIGGTLVALAAMTTGTARADAFPWVLPIRILTSEAPAPLALWGLGGGIVAFALMIADLSRREFR